MRMEGRGRGRVDLFNFSFLDVLACTIGLLIFIMTIIAITSSSPGNPKAAARLAEISRMQARAKASLLQALNSEGIYTDLLRKRAAQTLNLKGANAHLRRRIARLDRQAADYQRLAQQTNVKITAARKQLTKAQHLNNPLKATKLSQTIELTQEQMAAIKKRIAALKKLRVRRTVRYYIPYVRKTTRHNVFFEVADNRIWRIGSKDFHHKTIQGFLDEYTRRSGAVPDTLAQFVSPNNPPQYLVNNRPSQTVLIFLVRPSGFSTYQALELWARNKKYAVDWHPTHTKRSFIFRPVSSVSRQ